ncbi:MAG: hypothetical protein WCV67_13935 [Victivallaceae bacterium]
MRQIYGTKKNIMMQECPEYAGRVSRMCKIEQARKCYQLMKILTGCRKGGLECS